MRVAFHLVNVHSAPFLDFGEAQQGGTVSSGMFCAMWGTRQRKLWRDWGVLPPLGTGVPGVPKTGEQLLTQLSPDVAEVLSLFIGLGGVGDPSQGVGGFAHSQMSTLY